MILLHVANISFLFKIFSKVGMRPKPGFSLLLGCVCISIHLTTQKNMCISVTKLPFFPYRCTDICYTSNSPIESTQSKKEPNWRCSFCIGKCGGWGSNGRENYADLPLPPFPLSFVGVKHRRKKLALFVRLYSR